MGLFKKALFVVSCALLFIVILQSGTKAHAVIMNHGDVPDEIKKEISLRCLDDLNQLSGNYFYYYNDYADDGSIAPRRFNKYGYIRGNNHMSTNYIVNSSGELVSSLGYKSFFSINKDTVLKVKYVIAGCIRGSNPSGGHSRLTNVKVVADGGSTRFNEIFSVEPSVFYRGRGDGAILTDSRSPKGGYDLVGEFEIRVREGYESKLRHGLNIIRFKTSHCIRGKDLGGMGLAAVNYDSSKDGNDEADECMDVPMQIVIKHTSPPPNIPDSPSYKSSTNTFIKKSTESNWQNRDIIANVGETVHFKHVINTDFRSDFSTYKMNWRQDNDSVSSRDVGRALNLGSSAIGDTVIQGDSGGLKNHVRVTPYRVKNSDAGKTICENISYTWNMEYWYKHGMVNPVTHEQYHTLKRDSSKDDSGSDRSSPMCFYVPYEYELKPCVDATQGTSEIKCGGDIVAEPSGKLNIIPRISGSGTPVKPGTQYVITTWEVPASSETTQTPLSESTKWSNNPCSIYVDMFSQQAQKCLKSDSGSVVSTNQAFNNPLPEMPENAEFGRRYCVGLSIAPYRMLKDEGKSAQDLRQEWRHSAPVCAKAVKKPKMRVWNNGIYSQAGISMSKSNFKGNVFGSWVEYEAISNGRITGLTTEGSHGTNNLTFSNAHTELGNFGSPSVSDNDRIKAALESRFPRNSKDEGYLARDRVQNISNGDILRVRLLDSNETRIIYGGDITISGDQENSRIGQQTVIIANKIYIKPSVKRIDALLIADKVVTCANGASDDASYVSISNCDTPLTINGAVLTKDLKSYRTFGDHRNGEPAEIYNFRPDIYFWAKKFQSSAVIRTTYTKELPVRY